MEYQNSNVNLIWENDLTPFEQALAEKYLATKELREIAVRHLLFDSESYFKCHDEVIDDIELYGALPAALLRSGFNLNTYSGFDLNAHWHYVAVFCSWADSPNYNYAQRLMLTLKTIARHNPEFLTEPANWKSAIVKAVS